jgi:hypothetical protein
VVDSNAAVFGAATNHHRTNPNLARRGPRHRPSALDFRSGSRGVRSLERVVEHRQDEHEDAHRREDTADDLHAGVGDVVAEDDSGNDR